MLKSELIECLSRRADVTHTLAEDVVDHVFHAFTQSLKQGDRVEIRGFGAFYVKNYKAYTGRNPKTGKKIQVSPKKLPCWRTGQELRQRVRTVGSYETAKQHPPLVS